MHSGKNVNNLFANKNNISTITQVGQLKPVCIEYFWATPGFEIKYEKRC